MGSWVLLLVNFSRGMIINTTLLIEKAIAKLNTKGNPSVPR